MSAVPVVRTNPSVTFGTAPCLDHGIAKYCVPTSLYDRIKLYIEQLADCGNIFDYMMLRHFTNHKVLGLGDSSPR